MSETSAMPESGRSGSLPPWAVKVSAFVGLFVVGAMAGWIGRGVLTGPADVATMSMYQDWRLLCPASKEKDVSCEMSQDVIDTKAHQPVARLVLLRDKSKATVLAVTVPLNVLLEPGLGLKLGGDQVRVFQYKTCTEEGCLSVIPIDAQMEKTLATVSDAGIAVAGRDGKAVELPFSTKGFAEARKAFLNNEAKRASWWRRVWL
ncbi:MAG: invasion associated locus B family protein [Alphaproteobacteria bacterium]|nr:invasion associated locus B family protein [Alphaproteobacteria bacterium]